jgi:hypothetical protein
MHARVERATVPSRAPNPDCIDTPALSPKALPHLLLPLFSPSSIPFSFHPSLPSVQTPFPFFLLSFLILHF